MKINHTPQGILNPTTYKEAEAFALELGAVATRAFLVDRDTELYSTHFFNRHDDEVLLYCHMLNCITAFEPPRVWHESTKKASTPLARIKVFGCGWKLFNQRKDGSLGPLFINRKQRLQFDEEYRFEDHPTKGYAHRPGWHILLRPYAPRLKQVAPRVWARVEYRDFTVHERSGNPRGTWVLAKYMRIVGVVGEGGL